MTTGPLEGEILPAVEPAGEHTVTRTEWPWGVAWSCSCGQWEAVATGPSSARWAGDDHRRHVTAATRPKEPRP
jgi:hypothetical protein